MKGILKLLAFTFILGLFSCSKTIQKEEQKDREEFSREEVLKQKEIPVYGFEVIRTYPHSTDNYTEGFVLNDGFLYEGTGLYGHSEVIKSNFETGSILNKYKIDNFGEGITIIGDNLYQLTYITNTGFVFDKHTLQIKRNFSYPTQGWGLTTDGKSLIMSDGSSCIHFLNPETFKEEKNIFVSTGEKNIGFLNELEYIDGKIYANIWKTDFILIIEPSNGKILGWIDLKGINLDDKNLTPSQVLNGIAYNSKTQKMLITGKQWSKIYEIKLIRKS